MSWSFKSELAERKVAECDVKICELCGTLNSKGNKECFTCGWQGAFCVDSRLIHFAWQRLYTQYEDVRLKHVTGRHASFMGDMGVAHPQNRWQSIRHMLAGWWSGFQARRTERAAERAALYNPQHTHHPTA